MQTFARKWEWLFASECALKSNTKWMNHYSSLTYEQKGITRDNALTAGMGRTLDASSFHPLKQIIPLCVSDKICAVNNVALDQFYFPM
jgi:hypothetical protein